MNVLITGKNSYIGKNIKKCLLSNGHKVEELDMIGEEWKTFDFSSFDYIVHVAAIVHENAKSSDWETFHSVNTLLPYEVALKAKNAGAKGFVFFSTMAVYGQDKKLPKGNVINKSTPLTPVSMYGKSKLEAEQLLEKLNCDSFSVSYVRPPNVYGENCPGNYVKTFEKMVKKLPVFPFAYNDSVQSFLHIDNLSNLIRLIIENNYSGYAMPQDDFIPSTNDLIKQISIATNTKIKMSKCFGVLVKPFRFISVVNKLYGGVSYDYELSNVFNYEYQVISFKDGMKKTFKG